MGFKERQLVHVGDKTDILHEFFEVLCRVLTSD